MPSLAQKKIDADRRGLSSPAVAATPPALTANTPRHVEVSSHPTALADAVGERGNPVSTPPSELTSILAPFVNARLTHQRDTNGYVIERATFVDIEYGVCSRLDADIRGIGSEGIRAFFYNRSDLIAWADVSRITIRDASGARTEYRVVASHQRRAA